MTGVGDNDDQAAKNSITYWFSDISNKTNKTEYSIVIKLCTAYMYPSISIRLRHLNLTKV